MPVRWRIHASEVSTSFSSSAFVITRRGTYVASAAIFTGRMKRRPRRWFGPVARYHSLESFLGVSSPKYSYARGVATRPLGVRSRKPI